MTNGEWKDGLWDCSKDDYEASTHLDRHSSLEVYRRSPPLYHGRFIAGTVQKEPASDAMNLGTALHSMLFGGVRVVEAPKVDRRTKEGKERWTAFLAEAGSDCLALSPEQMALANGMREALMANRLARKLLVDLPGKSEQGARWHDETGLQMKVLFDRLLDDCRAADLKTSNDPLPGDWPNAAGRYGYHRQAALYRRCRNKLYGPSVADSPFLHVVVRNAPPFEVVVYQLSTPTLEAGGYQNLQTMTRLSDSKAFGLWKGPWDEEIVEVECKPWHLE